MSILVTPQKTSHWYRDDGTPFYEVPKKTGDGMRPATIRDAREIGAYPSVTNILSILSKPGLEAWKQEQAIISALTLPRGDGEPLDLFARRVVQDMGEQSRVAADFGSQVHAAFEANPDVYPPPEIAPYLAS